MQLVGWSTAVLNNGLGRYADAFDAREVAADESYGAAFAVSGADRGGRQNRQNAACARGAGTTSDPHRHRLGLGRRDGSESSSFTERWQGRRALVHRVDCVPRPHTAATDLARFHLLYGEWLDAKAAEWMLVSSCGPLTTCSPRWAPRHSRNGRGGSWSPQGRRSENAREVARPDTTRSLSLGWPETDGPIPRSERSCSSALARSNGTCGTCTPNSASRGAGTQDAVPARGRSAEHPRES